MDTLFLIHPESKRVRLNPTLIFLCVEKIVKISFPLNKCTNISCLPTRMLSTWCKQVDRPLFRSRPICLILSDINFLCETL